MKILTRTHFEKKMGKNSLTWEWRWRTEAANGESVGVGGEGYTRLEHAVREFLAQQGVVNRLDSSPYGPLEKFNPQHYVIVEYEEEKSKKVEK